MMEEYAGIREVVAGVSDGSISRVLGEEGGPRFMSRSGRLGWVCWRRSISAGTGVGWGVNRIAISARRRDGEDGGSKWVMKLRRRSTGRSDQIPVSGEKPTEAMYDDEVFNPSRLAE